ncbi:MAG: zinc-binding dehydrogenase [Nitrospinaceae bacterium]
MVIKAAVLRDLNRPLTIETLTAPELKAGQALVRIVFSGVCHSQLNEVRGRKGPDPFLPHTLGHEASGWVEAVGPGVTKVKAGGRVVLTWIKGAGKDVPATVYTGADGSGVNSGAISTFMNRAVIAENRLVPLPAGVPLKEMPLLRCALPTGAGIAINTLNIEPGASLAVFGVSGIGLSAVIGGVLQKAGMIAAVDIVPHKLALAKGFGATHTINAAEQDPVDMLAQWTGGKGVDYAIEASGVRPVMETAFRSVRDGGGVCVLAGNLPAGERIAIDPYDLIRGKRILGTWGGESRPDRDIPRFAEWRRAGKLQLEPLITNVYPLEQVNQALDDLERGQVGRAMLDMSHLD